MQIFERIKPHKKKQGQNLIEFSYVLPIMLFLTLAIFEIALYWQEFNAIHALNTEINANVALTDPRGMMIGDRCTALNTASTIIAARAPSISLNNVGWTTDVIRGSEPFALYRYRSTNTVAGKPQLSLWVDCRNPFENGVTTQLEFYHKTLIMKASIPRFDDPEPIVIIPDNVFISTPKLNSIRHY